MSDTNLANRRLGRYKIQERVGKGGMAQVFKAMDGNLDRVVAVKVMYENLSDDPTFKERFEREAKFVASFNHPNIVQVYDFDTALRGDQTVYYMVMRYIPGHTLKDELTTLSDKGRLMPRDRVLQITRNIAGALDYAHQRGMVHRDVKPGNILFDEYGQAVLTDFGIARLVENSTLTQDGLTVGTPAYMSPEQAAGEPIDGRSDIYALGVIVYEMLAGRPPFGSDSSLSILLKHLNEPVPSLSQFVHMSENLLDAVIFQALAKSPEDRFPTASAFADALERALGDADNPTVNLPRSQKTPLRIETPVNAAGADAKPAAGDRTSGALALVTRQIRTVTRSPLGILIVGMAVISCLVGVGLYIRAVGVPATAADDTLDVSSIRSDETGIESMADEAGDTESMSGPFYFTSTFAANDPFLRFWQLDEEELISRAVTAEGELRFTNERISRGVTTLFNPAYTYTDASIAMTALLEDGSATAAGYGIIFRYIDPDHYNVFTVDGAGRYSIWVRNQGEWTELRGLDENWTPSDAVNPLGQANALRVEIIGNQFTGYVNGQLVVDVSDTTYAEGGVGIYLASTRSGGASLLVDTFSVRSITPSMTSPGDGF